MTHDWGEYCPLWGLIALTQSTPFMESMTWTLQYKKEGVAGQGSLGCPKIEST